MSILNNNSENEPILYMNIHSFGQVRIIEHVFLDKFNLNDTTYCYGGVTQRTVYRPINQLVT